MSTRAFFINDLSTVVRQSLEGLVTVNKNLSLHERFNIVVAKRFDNNQVALVSGGGSVYEPSHAGFVGPGLLAASVSGSIFADPTAEEIFTAIKLVCWKGLCAGAGALLIVPNYTSDRLHFGSAKERAYSEGYNVDIFMFDDNCSFGLQTGRLGSGIFFIHKIAGALALTGSTMRTIKEYLESISGRIASIFLDGCNRPDRIPYISGQETINSLIERLTMAVNCLSQYFPCDGQTRIALLINDDGGLTTMEINIIFREAVCELTNRGFAIERVFSGRFITSFDRVGVCISIMMVNQRILELLDIRCQSANITQKMWSTNTVRHPSYQMIDGPSEDVSESMLQYHYNTIDRLISIEPNFIRCVSDACKAIISNESYLNYLDSESGDSDCGSTLATGAGKILSTIESGQLKASFLQLANIIETCMGGTSGALFSLFFTALSSAVTPLVKSNQNLYPSVELWASLIKHSCDTMTSYSYAKPGDRSLVDPLVCLVETLELFPFTDIESFAYVVNEVKKAAESTALMTAKIGRALYLPKPSNQEPDPGAWAIFLIVQAILTAPILSQNEN